MKANISKKQKAGIIATLLLAGSIIGLSTTTLAHPPQPSKDVRMFQGNVTVSLSAIDNDSGVNYTVISVWYRSLTSHNASWTLLLAPTNYTGNITYSVQGQYQVHFYSVDKLGNVEAEKYADFALWQDNTCPYTQITLTGNEIFPGK